MKDPRLKDFAPILYMSFPLFLAYLQKELQLVKFCLSSLPSALLLVNLSVFFIHLASDIFIIILTTLQI